MKNDKHRTGKILFGGVLGFGVLLILWGDGRRERGGRAVVGNGPIIRVPVIDPDGLPTNLHAVWSLPSPAPSYFYESRTDDSWLFEDPNGMIYIDPTSVAAGSPIAGRRYRPYYPVSRPIFMGDRQTSRRST